MSLSREDILNCDDKQLGTVPVPEWKGKVHIRSLTAREKSNFEKKMLSQKADYGLIMAEYVAAITVDEQGVNLFTPKDAEALLKKRSSALERIFEKGQELNSMSEEDIEELAKNSSSAPSEDTSLASQES